VYTAGEEMKWISGGMLLLFTSVTLHLASNAIFG
jgi:hypothetical protein